MAYSTIDTMRFSLLCATLVSCPLTSLLILISIYWGERKLFVFIANLLLLLFISAESWAVEVGARKHNRSSFMGYSFTSHSLPPFSPNVLGFTTTR
jgi:hypothetical protein